MEQTRGRTMTRMNAGDDGAMTRAIDRKAVAAVVHADTVARSVGAVGLAAIGLIHLLDAPGKLTETPYMFWMYVALIISCACGAGLLVRATSRRAWAVALALAAMPFLGYVLDRTIGLPGATGDIGNWAEPLGLASLFVEACVVALSLYAFSLLRDSGAGRLERQRQPHGL